MEHRSINAVLRRLLRRFEAGQRPRVYAHEFIEWTQDVRATLIGSGLLARTTDALSQVCYGCELECVVQPRLVRVRGVPRPMHYCEVRPDIGHVELEPEHLWTWMLQWNAVAAALGRGLGFDQAPEPLDRGRSWRLGTQGGVEILFTYNLRRGIPPALSTRAQQPGIWLVPFEVLPPLEGLRAEVVPVGAQGSFLEDRISLPEALHSRIFEPPKPVVVASTAATYSLYESAEPSAKMLLTVRHDEVLLDDLRIMTPRARAQWRVFHLLLEHHEAAQRGRANRFLPLRVLHSRVSERGGVGSLETTRLCISRLRRESSKALRQACGVHLDRNAVIETSQEGLGYRLNPERLLVARDTAAA